jgi:YVTN family beta-propeller protein
VSGRALHRDRRAREVRTAVTICPPFPMYLSEANQELVGNPGDRRCARVIPSEMATQAVSAGEQIDMNSNRRMPRKCSISGAALRPIAIFSTWAALAGAAPATQPPGPRGKRRQPRILATLISLSLCACGGGGGGGVSQSSIKQPVSSGSSPNPVATISALSPSCAPAGEQFIDGVDNQLFVIGPTVGSNGVGSNFVAGSVVRWNGSDRPTTGNGSVNALTAQISASDIAAAGTAVVTVFNPAPGGGSSNSLTFTITTGAVDPQSIAVDPAGKFAYAVNGGCNGGVGAYVSMYTINPTTGALASIGPPVWTLDGGDYPGSVTVAPSGKFVYVTNSGDVWDPDYGSVAMYTVDTTTGALTSTGAINGNCPGLCFPAAVVVDPSGKFAYVASGGGGFPYNVEMYTINATSGALTSIGSIAAGTDPVAVAVDPAGKFAYVTDSGSNDVSMYSIDATTGALESIGTIAAGTDPVSIAVDPAGKFAYVADSGSNDVSMYSIDSTTGSLTLMGMIAAGLSPTSIAMHPSGNFAYVTNSGSNDVLMFSIASTGTLTLIGTIGT